MSKNSNFDEKSGVICHDTSFGKWYQTVGEVTVLVDLNPGTRGKQVQVVIKPSHIKCVVKDTTIFEVIFAPQNFRKFRFFPQFMTFKLRKSFWLLFQGPLFSTVIEDESVWTIEDQKLLRIQLVKADEKVKDQCWISLLKNQFVPDPFTLNEMRKKLDLERFQLEVD